MFSEIKPNQSECMVKTTSLTDPHCFLCPTYYDLFTWQI